MKNKIMFIDKNKIVNFSGGVERVICNFANEFIDRGYDTCIVCIDTEKGVPFFDLKPEVEFINLCFNCSDHEYDGLEYKVKKMKREVMRGLFGRNLSAFGHKFNDPREQYFYDEFISRLAKCIDDVKPDIILPTDVESTWVVFEAMNIIDMNIPVISMCHSDPERLIYTPEYIDALKKCVAVQVLLPIYSDFFKEKGIKNVIDIPNVVKQCSDDQVRNLSSPNNKIITVGRIDGAGKRQHLLIEAFAKIADKYPEWTVHIYGDVANKKYKKKLDKIIEDNYLSDRVFFEGTTNDIFSKLREADIFAFPTEYEGFSMALSEAMSVGLPVISCNDCRSVVTVLGNSGILCEPNSGEYADQLINLMSDTDKRIYLGTNARQRIKDYSSDVIWNSWSNVIEGVLK